ncbi:MAG TPA: hypothetical protein VLB83_02680, partial [Candidatus Paceibacterota bacterium]|nr:hypothetical protein [Candidatus Paceibacterota bacterium]
IQAAGVVAYVIIGIGWGMLRWDDLSAHLHRRRGEEIGRILKVVEKCFSDVLFQSREIRNRLKLDESEPLPELPELSETAQLEWIQKYAHRLELVAGSLSGQESLHALIKLLEQRKRSCRDVWKAHLSCDGSNRQYEENIPDEKLVKWIANLNSGRYPPELQAFLQEYETKWVASVSVGDHKGQIYLWTAFWPWSMGFRILRKILTLKLLRDIFIFVFNRLRFIYDRIAARHEVKFEMAPREPESPTSPTDSEKVMPIRHQASGGDLI